MKTSHEKGLELEHAVHAIEEVILESSPSLRGQPFDIKPRKIITVNDVHNEIDIFVTVGAARGYESTFIFECKNWEDPVGKNEILVFSEKIRVARAQLGYFVAKAYTKDALAQAATDPRMTILYANEHDITEAVPPDGFHITVNAGVKCRPAFRARGGVIENKRESFAVPGKIVQMHGTDMLLSDYLNSWMDELYAERSLRFYTANLPEGVHPLSASDERVFHVGECVIDGRDMESVRLEADFDVQILRPSVISDYEIASRGRVVRLAKVQVRDLAIDLSFVKTTGE